MAQSKLEVRAADGTMDVHLHAPPGAGRAPTVVFFMDGGGIRQSLHDMAEKLASHGYLVAMPNLFYRAGAYKTVDTQTVFSAAPERERLMAMIKAATGPSLVGDVGAVLDALANLPEARADQVGT